MVSGSTIWVNSDTRERESEILEGGNKQKKRKDTRKERARERR